MNCFVNLLLHKTVDGATYLQAIILTCLLSIFIITLVDNLKELYCKLKKENTNE